MWSQTADAELRHVGAFDRHVDESVALAAAAVAASGRPPADVVSLDVAPIAAGVPRDLDRRRRRRYGRQQDDDRSTPGQLVADVYQIERRICSSSVG